MRVDMFVYASIVFLRFSVQRADINVHIHGFCTKVVWVAFDIVYSICTAKLPLIFIDSQLTT